jgi:hypothetical protein
MPQQVTCINKRGDHYDPHERINHIGGAGWRVTQAEGIEHVEADPRSYFVSAAAGSVWVTVGVHNGHKYLTTEADGASQNNLLALREC